MFKTVWQSRLFKGIIKACGISLQLRYTACVFGYVGTHILVRKEIFGGVLRCRRRLIDSCPIPDYKGCKFEEGLK